MSNSRDVTFREHLFPFKEETIANEDLFPCEVVGVTPEETTQLDYSNSPHCSNAPATIHIVEQVVSKSPVSPPATPPSD